MAPLPALVLVALLGALRPGAAVASLGFSAPFTTVNASGDRMVSEWAPHGDAAVMQNFVRLTPAQSSRHGAFWGDRPLGVEEFSAIFRFRISGPAKGPFGDGLALWFVQSPATVGPFHGFADRFVGFGLLFSNSHHAGSGNAHDVQLVINDGTRSVPQMQADGLGCDAQMRYHEARADFSVFNATRISLSYKQNTLTVGIDPRNRNDWVECITVRLQLAPGWLRTARLGLTATTSEDRMDNHDVLSLKIYPYATDIQTAGIEDVSHPDRNTLDHLVHHLEHQLAEVQTGLQQNLQTLQAQEHRSQERIEKLEDSLSLRIMGVLEARIKALESVNVKQLREAEAQAEERITKLEAALNSEVYVQLEGRLDHLRDVVDATNTDHMGVRVAALETTLTESLEARVGKLDRILKDQIEAHVTLMEGEARTFGWPFLIFSAGIGALLLFLWFRYRSLTKRFML